MNRDIRRYLARVADGLDQTEQSALSAFPLPVTVCSAAGEVIWYNERFRSEVLDGIDVYGSPVTALTDGLPRPNSRGSSRRTRNITDGNTRCSPAGFRCGTPT